MVIPLKTCLCYYLILCYMPNIFPLSPFADHPTILKVDDRQRLARERREEREKQLGKAYSILVFLLFFFLMDYHLHAVFLPVC